MTRLIVGIIVVAVVSATGDYIWYELGVRHRMWVGVLHGAVLLTAVGATLGAASGRTVAGLPVGAVAGIAGALTYYALVPVLRSSAMIAAWAALWIILAVLDGFIVRRRTRTLGECLGRGVVAAIASGITFYLVVDQVWGHPPGSRNYLQQFALWAIAWAPGILAIGGDVSGRDARARR